jgi:hypothetical protein
MRIQYKPLEETLGILESYARKGNRRGFDDETRLFHERMAKLQGLHWVADISLICQSYQTRYEQIKMMMEGKR